MKKDLFGLGKGYLIVILGLLAVSGYADPARSSDLIIDARHENVVWFANTENCVERSVTSGVSLSAVWSGDLTFLGTERKVISSYDEEQEVLTPKKCESKSENGSDDLSCFDVSYVNVTKYRTDWLPFDGKTADLSSIASELEQKTSDVLSTAESSEKTEKEEIIRFCFRTGEKTGQAHISYIALSDSEYASDESTDVNITSQSLNWQPSTPANNSAIIINLTQVNISIETDHPDTFLFNWNGTNYLIYNSSSVLWLNFNNNSIIGDNSTYFIDISKYGDNGSCSGSTCPAYTSGIFGSALQFDGSNDYVSFPTDVFPVGNTEITFSAWVKIMNSGSGNYVIGYGPDASGPAFPLMNILSNNKLHFEFGSGAGGVTGNTALSTGMWYYVVSTYNKTQTKVYVNGVLDGTTSYSSANISRNRITDSANVGSIGAIFSIYGNVGSGSTRRYGTFNGLIDEVRIYNRSLSSQEIRFQYQTDFQKYNSTEYRYYNNITNLTQGTYSYYGWANDTFGNSASSETRTLTYDTSYPVTQLVAPANNTIWTASSLVNFTYNVSQTYAGINYCNLTVNNSVLNSSSNITKDTNQTLYASLVNGIYNWSVNCTGQNGLMNRSTTYTVSVATTTTTTTATTTTTILCGLGSGCGSCTGWAYINAASGTLQALDGDNNGKYDLVCCGGLVSNYAVL